MAKRSGETVAIPPEGVLEILRARAGRFEISAGEDMNAQTITGEMGESSHQKIVYRVTQLFPGRLLKEVELVLKLAPAGEGSRIEASGHLVRCEAPPGTPIDGSQDVDHELKSAWTFLKNKLVQEITEARVDTVDRNYNAGMRELFFLLKNPALLAPAYYIVTEKDEEAGKVVFQDPTGSMVYLIRRMAFQEPGTVVYKVESNTSNMWSRSGLVEMEVGKVNEARSRLTVRSRAGPAQLSEQMQMSAMYLPPEQLAGYLSFRQDLGQLMGWIDAAVLREIPHIRDMIVVQGDFVAGGKVEIKDSVVSRATIQTGGAPDDGKYLVHADRSVEGKVEVTDSVVSRSDITASRGKEGGAGGAPPDPGQKKKSLEVYMSSMKAAFEDGRIDDSEAAMMATLRSSLKITPEDHAQVLEELGVLDTDDLRKYQEMLATALADRKIDTSEEAVLRALRQQYGVPLMVHEALVTRLTRTA